MISDIGCLSNATPFLPSAYKIYKLQLLKLRTLTCLASFTDTTMYEYVFYSYFITQGIHNFI